MTAQAEMVFEDNRLLPLLYGEHDANLARIEHQLGVALHNRGNALTIVGSDDEVRIAQEALEALWQRVRRGVAVDLGEIDAALRLAGSGTGAGATGLPEGGEAAAPTLPGFDRPIEAFNAASSEIRTPRRVIRPRSPMQARYIEALKTRELVFGVGPAGTGKTYMAVAMGVACYAGRLVDRLILSRPAVEAGERLGFLPGDLKEKIDPYLRPLYDALYDTLPADRVRRDLDNGAIEVAPLAFMRGRTLSNAFIILDEAQNTSPMQMRMFLTRLGENSRMAVTGDTTQTDLPPGQRSGLEEAVSILEDVEGVGQVRFTNADVVRHDLVTRIVRAYESLDEQAGRGNAPASGGSGSRSNGRRS